MEKYIVKRIALTCLTAALLTPALAMAASLEPTAAPSDAASAFYRMDDVYNRLQSGAAGAKRTGGFSEPSAGPADGASKTMDDIMAAAPAADNTNGAAPGDVKAGRTYWGLRTDGSWGRQTGTSTAPYPALVPKSGQTTCYNDTGTVIGCAGTGQDGAKLMGAPLPNPRFTDSGNGTVKDNLTGLIWLKSANCASVSPRGWSAAQTAVAALQGDGTMCNLSDGSVAGDWRVPNPRELSSLIHLQYSSPALSNTAGTGKWTEGNPFSGVQSTYYWSSATQVGSPGYAWYVHFGHGYVNVGSKSSSYAVWPVRGGQ